MSSEADTAAGDDAPARRWRRRPKAEETTGIEISAEDFVRAVARQTDDPMPEPPAPGEAVAHESEPDAPPSLPDEPEPAVIDEIVSRVAQYTSPDVAASLPLDDVEDEFGDIPMSQTARELNDAVVAARAQHEALRRANRAVSAAEARAVVADTVAAEQAEIARAATDSLREAEARAAESDRTAAEAESARAAAEESERRQREMALEAESAAAETGALAAEAREEADAALATVAELQERVAELERVAAEIARSRDEAEQEAVVLSQQLAEIAAAATRRTPAAFAQPVEEAAVEEPPVAEPEEPAEQPVEVEPVEEPMPDEPEASDDDPAVDTPESDDLEDPIADEPVDGIHLDADPPAEDQVEPPPAPEPTPTEVASGRTLHRPYEYIRRGSAGLIGAMVAIGCAAAVAVIALTGQLEDYIGAAVGLTVVALLAALFAYQRLGTASEVRLSADGQLTYVVGGSEHTFDVAGDSTEIEVVGDPGDSGWEVRLVRRGLSPLTIGPRNVDPLEFTRALRQWRPTL